MAKTAAQKLAAVTSVNEPPDANYAIEPAIWTYEKGHSKIPLDKWNFRAQITDLRLDLQVVEASTVEIDLQDSDFQVLSDPLFCNWAWSVQDVSLSSQKKFKATTLRNSTDTAYLGDEADLEWVLGAKPIDLEIGRVFYRLCGIQTQQMLCTLTFEDRCANMLRDYEGALSWDRAKHTRAQFVAMLCRQAGVEYFIPEINVLQPVEVDETATSSTSSAATGTSLAAGAQLTMGGIPLTKGQLNVVAGALSVAKQMNAPKNAVIALCYAMMGESSINPNTSGGLLQTTGDPSAYAGGTDYLGQVRGFLSGGTSFGSPGAIAAAKRGDPPWQIANETEVNAVWLSSKGDSYGHSFPGGQTQGIAEATKMAGSYGGPAAVSSTSTSSQPGAYTFARGSNEDSWDCIQRLASEVGWYAFARQNKLWFVSGNYLFAQQSQLLAEIKQNGVEYIDVDLDTGERDQIAQCDIYANTTLWTALPGMCVGIVNRGPATGKWYVNEVQATPLNPTQNTQITVYKPIPKRAEPAATTSNSGTSAGNVVGTAGNGTAAAAYWCAQQLSAKKLNYTKAARSMVPLDQISQGQTLYDCSASVSWVLLRAGFQLPGGVTWGGWAPVSGDFTTGQAGLVSGPGTQMTIWANSDHIFIEFMSPKHMQANTSVPGFPGFTLAPWGPNGSTDAAAGNFYPVHYPGT